MNQTINHESASLISADKVEGTTVYNRAGDKLGSVEDVMIDKLSGKVAYAVLSFGGFLGIGDRHHPLPWSMLSYDTDKSGYVVDLDKERLTDAPSYPKDQYADIAKRSVGEKLHDYYRVPPYWV